MGKVATSWIAFLIAIVMIAMVQPGTCAWSNGGYSSDPNNPDYGTHDWVADAALAIQTKDVSFITGTYHVGFLLGTEAPDNGAYIGDSTNHHVYFYSSGDLQDGKSAIRASSMFDIALGYLTSQDLGNASYYIGAMTHYVADVGAFGHTMGSGTDWGAEKHHSDYENRVESMIGSLPAPTGLPLGDSDAYASTLDLARKVTFGTGAIEPNTWMDTNYDWSSSIFVSSAKASLNASIVAVAASINHLLIEASYSPSPDTPPEPSAPDPPSSISAFLTEHTITLAWSPPLSDGGRAVSGYRIYRGTDAANPSLVATVADYVRSWTDESVERGVTYFYWVAAENSVGLSTMSEVASANVPSGSGTLVLFISTSIAVLASAAGGMLLWRRGARGRTRH